jgi:hypothetical protein
MLRTIEVVKARFQAHVWGRHQLKIYEPFSGHESRRPPAKPDTDRVTRLRRAHPYREEGGIFIFPSIHYILSRYKNESPSQHVGAVKSPVLRLDKFLGVGFPKGRCTALIGDRGTHKSHLGYLQVLNGILEKNTRKSDQHAGNARAIVVSLRDDEGSTRQTMAQILTESFNYGDKDKANRRLRDLERHGLLEITHYPPGFITPEEFFHRLLLSIRRIKGGSEKADVSLLFNSLDQLSSRFPLCAAQRIFIPGIIAMLSAEGVTSYFVAADDIRGGKAHKGSQNYGDHDYYGLDAMAELILRLRRVRMEREAYYDLLVKARDDDQDNLPDRDAILSVLPPRISSVELSVERFAGGQPAGAAGLLELIGQQSTPVPYKIVQKNGLFLIPYAGDKIQK